MSLYLDASVLVSLFVDDLHTPRAKRLALGRDEAFVGVWGAVEYSSALARRQRMGALEEAERTRAEAEFDAWIRDAGGFLDFAPSDFADARSYVQASRMGLRGPDALHLALAARCQLDLATFDLTLSAAAREFGVACADIQ